MSARSAPRRKAAPRPGRATDGAVVVLVDDVVTSGATLSEAAAVLAAGRSEDAVPVLAAVVAAVCLLDLLMLHGKGEGLLFVLAGVPAVLLWSVQAEVTSREEDGFVLASRVRPQGRLGKGIYRVPTS